MIFVIIRVYRSLQLEKTKKKLHRLTPVEVSFLF